MLDAYLEKMLEITFQADEHLGGDAPSEVGPLAAARAEQAMTITAYQLYIHREVFEPIRRSGTPQQIAVVRDLKVECIMLAEEFRAFARLWTLDAVRLQWHAYQPAALVLRDRIRTHVANVRRNAAVLGVEPRPQLVAGSHF